MKIAHKMLITLALQLDVAKILDAAEVCALTILVKKSSLSKDTLSLQNSAQIARNKFSEEC